MKRAGADRAALQKTRGWIVVITLPISGFVLVVRLAVCGLPCDGIQMAHDCNT